MSTDNDGATLTDQSTRRGILKLAGAAAVGAAAATGLRALSVKAAGSGNTLDLFAPLPFRLVDTRTGHGPLVGGTDYDFGPFPAFSGFDSTSYYGMVANLTATGWNTPGWFSIRAQGTTLSTVSNLNFSGNLSAIANLSITRFGLPVSTTTSNGMVTIHCGGPAFLSVHMVLDVFAYLGPDQ